MSNILGALIPQMCSCTLYWTFQRSHLVRRISTKGWTAAAPWRSKPVRSSRWWCSRAGRAPWAAEARASARMERSAQVRRGHLGSWADTGRMSNLGKRQTPWPGWRTPHPEPRTPRISLRNRTVARRFSRRCGTPCTGNNRCQNIHRAKRHSGSSGYQNRGCTASRAPPRRRLAPRSQRRSRWGPARADAPADSCTGSPQSCLRWSPPCSCSCPPGRCRCRETSPGRSSASGGVTRRS